VRAKPIHYSSSDPSSPRKSDCSRRLLRCHTSRGALGRLSLALIGPASQDVGGAATGRLDGGLTTRLLIGDVALAGAILERFLHHAAEDVTGLPERHGSSKACVEIQVSPQVRVSNRR